MTGFHGFGVNTFLSIINNFPGVFENFVFVSISVVDSGSFKGRAELEALAESTRRSLDKYVDLAREMGFAADCRMDLGTDVVDSAVPICRRLAQEYPYSTFFAGQIVFRHEHYGVLIKRIDHLVGQGDYFVTGSHPLSVDSRQFGPIEINVAGDFVMDLTKAMAEKFGEECDKQVCKEAIRLLMESEKTTYSYVGGSYVVLNPNYQGS